MRMMRTWGVAFGALATLALMSGLSGAGEPRSWGPQIGPSNPRHLDKSKLMGVGGPHGELVRCGGKPLLLDMGAVPPDPPWKHRVKITTLVGRGFRTVVPGFVPRCAGPGRVAWYVPEEDPLRKDSYPGAPITLQIPLPQRRVSGHDLGFLVGTGGCVPVNGEVPPCVPDIPSDPFRARPFKTFRPTVLDMKARIVVQSTWVKSDETSGSATVQLQLEVDGNLLGDGKAFTLPGDEKRNLLLHQRFRLPAGRHQVGLQLTGTGYNHVNVEGKSARVNALLSKTFHR